MFPLSLGSGVRQPLRVVCLGSHSDDIEIGCGGALGKLLDTHVGSSVTWMVFSAHGQREAEARASAATWLASAAESRVIIHDFRESYFPYVGAQIKDAFEEMRRSVEPDIVFSHHRRDLHQDHRTIAELTWNTFRNHLILEYEIPKYEGDLGNPNLFVPLTLEESRRKVDRLMSNFPSQHARAWFRPDTFQALMVLRGIECQAAEGRAEAFHVRKLVI